MQTVWRCVRSCGASPTTQRRCTPAAPRTQQQRSCYNPCFNHQRRSWCHAQHSRSAAAALGTASRRQAVLQAAAAALVAAAAPWVPRAAPPAAAAAKQRWASDPAFLKAFQAALSASGSFEERDEAWSRAVALGPDNAAALSNRGTLRLQVQRWQAAWEDLSRAAALEQQQTGAASAVVLNNLGNVEGALGRWPEALRHYSMAADDPELGAIAGANYALAAFETGQDDVAIKAARTLLRRDPEFLDARAALTAFLWGAGRRAQAEGEWEALQQAGDGLGAALYGRSAAVARVQHRWPPRATAALVAFLALADRGQAEGYDLVVHEYTFAGGVQ